MKWYAYKASANDDEQNKQLDDTKEVLEAQTPLQSKAMDQERGCDAGKTNTTLIPPGNLNLSSVKDVLSEDNTVRARPALKVLAHEVIPNDQTANIPSKMT